MISMRKGVCVFLIILTAIGFDCLVMDPMASIVLNGAVGVIAVTYPPKKEQE